MKGTQEPVEPPPEALLLQRARQARGLTRAEAAERSGVVKASRWGQIENGYLMKDGAPMPTKAGAMQLAHMANVTGVRPEQLDAAGRRDAAEILREIQQQEAERQQSHGPVSDPRVEMAERILNELPPRVRAEVLRRFGGELPAPSDPPDGRARGREAG